MLLAEAGEISPPPEVTGKLISKELGLLGGSFIITVVIMVAVFIFNKWYYRNKLPIAIDDSDSFDKELGLELDEIEVNADIKQVDEI
jgi:hypothetical protein